MNLHYLKNIYSIALVLGGSLFGYSQTTVFSYSGIIDSYIVPAGVTNIQIEAIGASGGVGTTTFVGTAGKGASMQGDFTVTPGQVLKIIVGGKGQDADHVGGGGGGSFVWDNATSTLLIAAGGGGGGGKTDLSDFTNVNGLDASTTNDGTNGAGMVDGAGTGGNGGTVPTCINWASGGAGWNTNGANGSLHGCTYNSTGGQTPLSGGAGGSGGGGSTAKADGGFGGGGGNNARCGAVGGGGGGGYSGGGAGGEIGSTGNYNAGGGGGSYNAGTSPVNTAGVGTGNGQVTITVLCTPLVTSVSADTICDGEMVTLSASSSGSGTVSWDGGVTDGVAFVPPLGTTTYTATSTDPDDCDFSIDIVVNPLPTVDAGLDVSICEGDSVTLNATGTADTYTWDGGVTDGVTFLPPGGTTSYIATGEITLTGCQSTDTVDVTYNLIDETLTVAAGTLTSNQAGATYQWVECPAYTAISGETNQSFTPTNDGDYALIITLNGCMDTSACETIAGVGLNELIQNGNFMVYPNPVNDMLTIATPGNFSFRLTDIAGRVILEGNGTDKTQITTSELESGTYLIRLLQNDEERVVKVIKR